MSEKKPPPDDPTRIIPPDETSTPSENQQEFTRTSVPPPLEPTTIIQSSEPETSEPTTVIHRESTEQAYEELNSEPTQIRDYTQAPEVTTVHENTQVTGFTEPSMQMGEGTRVNEPSVNASEPGMGTRQNVLTQVSTSPSPEEPTNWKGRLASFGQKVKGSGWFREFGAKLQNFEPAQAAEWANKRLQKQKSGIYGKAATIALCAFFLADLTALLLGRFIPEPPISHALHTGSYRRPKTIDDYGIVFTRNLFNSQGLIPGEGNGSSAQPDMNNAPVRTTLPFNLIGTVILQDELRSIATIEDKSASAVYPVRETDEIPSKAKIVRIEPRKVIFTNTASGRLEFVDLPEEPGMPTSTPKVAVGKGGGPGVEKVSPTQFNVSRSEVDKALADLNKVLTEARAVPNFENGVANGYKLFQIVPNSIYDKLGLQNGDVIVGLNGAVINDPGKAFEMLSELKTSNHLELQVKKDGKVQNNIYDIR